VHLTSNPVDWYAARAAGITAYVLLTAVVVLGLALAGRAPGRRWRRWPMFAVEDVHRTGGLLVGAFIAIHIVTIAVDSFLPFSPVQLVVPLASGYRPLWTGLGIAAAELLLALAVTNHYRSRLPYRWWRGAHYANFGVWAAATLHGLGSGTDRSAPWMIAVYAVSVALVLSLIVWRRAARAGASVRIGSAVALAVVGVAGVLGLAAGPLQAHHRPWNATVFHDSLTGHIIQQAGSTLAIVSMTGQGHGSQNVLVRADLLVGNDGLHSTTFQLEYLPSGTICKGKVTHVHAYGFTGICRMGGVRRVIRAGWRPVANGASLRGRIDAHV
jgi:methionine sulfoxide reductase heme-binding subunit